MSKILTNAQQSLLLRNSWRQLKNISLWRGLFAAVGMSFLILTLAPSTLLAGLCEDSFSAEKASFSRLMLRVSTAEPKALRHSDFGAAVAQAEPTTVYDLFLGSFARWSKVHPENPGRFPIPRQLQQASRDMLRNYIEDLVEVRNLATPEYLNAFTWQLRFLKKKMQLGGEVPSHETIRFELDRAISNLGTLLSRSTIDYQSLIDMTFEYSFLMQLKTINEKLDFIDVFRFPVWSREHLTPHFASPLRLLNETKNGLPGFYIPSFADVSRGQIVNYSGTGLFVLGLTRKASHVDSFYLSSYHFTMHDAEHTGGQFIHGSVGTPPLSDLNFISPEFRRYQSDVLQRLSQVPEPYNTVIVDILFQIIHEKSVPFDRHSLKKVIVGSQSYNRLKDFIELAIGTEVQGQGVAEIHTKTIETLRHPKTREVAIAYIRRVLDFTNEPLLSDAEMEP